MEWNDLYPFVLLLILVGMIIGVGVLTLDKFSVATKVTTAAANESITVVSGVATLTNDETITLTEMYNGTLIHIADNDSATTHTNVTNGGLVTSLTDGLYNVSYGFLADSASSLVIDDATAEVSGISTNWLGLIVTVVVLSIILSLVITSFTGNRR